MSKVLITEQYLSDIGEAIRVKSRSNEVFYPSEMADAILNIPTGSGGLNLNTSLVLVADTLETRGPVTLTATLKADYDDISPTDIDLHGFLSGATVTFYDDEGTSLYTGITNNNGIVTLDLVINSDITIYCSFSGTSDYNECTSNNVTIIKKSYLFYDTCDSDININHYVESSISQRNSTPAHALITYDSTENAYRLIGQSPYFVMEEIPELNGLDNYVISADMKVSSTSAFNQIGFGIHEDGNQNITYVYRIRGDNKVQTIIENGSVGETTIYSNSTSNIWFTMKVTKQGNNFNLELLKDGNTVNTYNWTIPTFTNARCGFIKQTEQSYQMSYIRNIVAEAL